MNKLQPLTIGLMWHSMNSDNLGIGALTIAHIEILRSAAAAEGFSPNFLVFSWRDFRIPYSAETDISSCPFRFRELVRPGGPVARNIAKCDIIFDIGGGDSFTDIYGKRRFLTIWWAKIRALAAGKPLVIAPQTIGPFSSYWSRLFARLALNRARFIVSRDHPSTDFISKLGVRGEVIEATDLAMRLSFSSPEPRDENSKKTKVGLNVSGLLFNGGYNRSNQFMLRVDYQALVVRVIEYFLSNDDTELYLIGHVQSDRILVEDDQRVAEKLSRDFPKAIVAPRFSSPVEAKSYISSMDFFVGSRMHATIAAFSSGVPVIPMAYSRKFSGVFGTLGYYRGIDMRSDDLESAMDKILEGFSEREAVKLEIDVAMDGVQRRIEAYEDRVRRELSLLC